VAQERFDITSKLKKTDVIASPQGAAISIYYSEVSVSHDSTLMEVAASLRSSQ